LVAIVVADIVGYSRLVEKDENGTLSAVKTLRREIIHPLLFEHHGRIVKLMGDGAIAEFCSVVDAATFAVTMQKEVAADQAQVSLDRRIVFRIGINLGDVVVEDGDLLGDGVNVAARLEQLCEPGGVLISGTAYDHLHGKLDLPLEFIGEQHVKNISRLVRIYRIRLDGQCAGWRLKLPSLRQLRLPTAAALAFLAGGVLSGWLPWESQVATAMLEPITLSLPNKPSIDVLPFDSFGSDPEWAFLKLPNACRLAWCTSTAPARILRRRSAAIRCSAMAASGARSGSPNTSSPRLPFAPRQLDGPDAMAPLHPSRWLPTSQSPDEL
jgi:class 3 adenylate cyclase